MPLGRGLSSLIPPKKSTDTSSLLAKPEEKINKPSAVSSGAPVLGVSVSDDFVNLPSEVSNPVADADTSQGEIVPSEPTFVSKAQQSAVLSEEDGARSERPSEYMEEGSVYLLEVDKIKPNPYQPRREFNEEQLQELAQSIREFGILQPLVVSKVERDVPNGTEVEYQIIAGERRYRAAKIVGLERVPAIVRQTDTNRTKLELAIIENVQRSDLSPVEAGRAYARLQDEFGLTQREIAQRVGKSREVVANTLRLLNLPTHMQEALSQGKINESQARLLLSLSSIEKQQQMFDNLISNKLSVRKLREKISPSKDPEGIFYERKLEEYLGSPVKMSRQGEGGKLVIQFYSTEEWKALMEKILRGAEEL